VTDEVKEVPTAHGDHSKMTDALIKAMGAKMGGRAHLPECAVRITRAT